MRTAWSRPGPCGKSPVCNWCGMRDARCRRGVCGRLRGTVHRRRCVGGEQNSVKCCPNARPAEFNQAPTRSGACCGALPPYFIIFQSGSWPSGRFLLPIFLSSCNTFTRPAQSCVHQPQQPGAQEQRGSALRRWEWGCAVPSERSLSPQASLSPGHGAHVYHLPEHSDPCRWYHRWTGWLSPAEL